MASRSLTGRRFNTDLSSVSQPTHTRTLVRIQHPFWHVYRLVANIAQENYDNADVFDGFRFSRLREERHAPVSPDTGGTGIFKSHMVSTATDHIVFGHGHHACPGRYVFVSLPCRPDMEPSPQLFRGHRDQGDAGSHADQL